MIVVIRGCVSVCLRGVWCGCVLFGVVVVVVVVVGVVGFDVVLLWLLMLLYVLYGVLCCCLCVDVVRFVHD